MIPMGGLRYLPNPRMVAEDPETFLGMGLTAERLADEDGIGREEQDRFAFESHRKALEAQVAGRFSDEIVPVTTRVTDPGPDGRPSEREVVLDRDEGPRADTSAEALAKLRPAFKAGGTVTAGNSSQTSDGAAAALLTTPEIAAELGVSERTVKTDWRVARARLEEILAPG